MIDDVSDIWFAPDGWPIRRARIDAGDAPDTRRGSLLFLSGRGDHMEKYAETLHDWAGRGWMVESFDWRGQGGSGRLGADSMLGHVEDFESWIADLEAYGAEWRSRTPAPYVIIGHSMGGHLLLRALAEKRVRVDAAVLIAPMLGINAAGLPHALGGGIAALACAFGHSGRSLWSPVHHKPAKVEALRNRLTHSHARFEQELRLRRERPELVMDAPSWGWLRAAYRSIHWLERPGVVEAIATPVLILASRADRLVTASAIARMGRRLRHGQMHFYGQEAAHEILREVDSVRDDALARIDAFLDEQAPPPEGRE